MQGRGGWPWVGGWGGRAWVSGGPSPVVSQYFFLLSLISDKMFPALGFGAQLPPDWKVSKARLFPLGQDRIGVGGLSEICGEVWDWAPGALPSLSSP